MLSPVVPDHDTAASPLLAMLRSWRTFLTRFMGTGPTPLTHTFAVAGTAETLNHKLDRKPEGYQASVENATAATVYHTAADYAAWTSRTITLRCSATAKVYVRVWLFLMLAMPALAGTITKPFTFSAGTNASSSQVNSNFDTIYNEFNGGLNSENIETGGISVTADLADDVVTDAKVENAFPRAGGAAMTVTMGNTAAATQSQVTVTAAYLAVEDASGNLRLLSSVSEVVDITVTGTGGAMTGITESADTSYTVWVIHDSSGSGTTNAIYAAEDDDTIAELTFPTGYTYARLIGWIRNDGSSNLLQFYQRGNEVQYQSDGTAVVAGTAYNSAWVDVDCSARVPIGAVMFDILSTVQIEHNATNTTTSVEFGTYAINDALYVQLLRAAGANEAVADNLTMRMPSVTQGFGVRWTGTNPATTDTVTVYVTSYRVNLH